MVLIAISLGAYHYVVKPSIEKRAFARLGADITSTIEEINRSQQISYATVRSCNRSLEKYGNGRLSCQISTKVTYKNAGAEGELLRDFEKTKAIILNGAFVERADHSLSGSQNVAESIFTPLKNTTTGYDCTIMKSSEASTVELRCSHSALRAYFLQQ